MRQVAILAAVFFMALSFAISSPKAHAAPIPKANKNHKTTIVTASAPTQVTVTVQAGDTLSQLAGQYATTVQRLFDANKQISDPNLIFPGERLIVPSKSDQLDTRVMPGNTPAPMQSSTNTTPTAAAPVDPTTSAATPTTTSTTPSSSGSANSNTDASSTSVWDQLAMCESSGNWEANTGNGFYGGLQFTLESWQAVGGTGYPNDASQSEQIAMAEKLLALQGWNAWPVCSAELGL